MSKFHKQAEPEKRRFWDKEEYGKRARERRDAEEKDLFDKNQTTSSSSRHGRRSRDPKDKYWGVERDSLKQHSYIAGLNEKIGKKTEISDVTPLDKRGGWYCNVCECQLKDSHTYLDHINGKRHQRRLGRSMRVEESTLEQVKNRFNFHKKRKYGDFINNDNNINNNNNKTNTTANATNTLEKDRRTKTNDDYNDDECHRKKRRRKNHDTNNRDNKDNRDNRKHDRYDRYERYHRRYSSNSESDSDTSSSSSNSAASSHNNSKKKWKY